jgi:hypothetical protein
MVKNNFFQLAVAFWVLIFATVGSSYAQEREIPKRWREVKICGLSFLIPKELKNQKIRGIDSCVASFEGKKITLGMDYGAYTAAPESETIYPDTKRELLEIDGKKAHLATYSYGARIYVLVGKSDFGKHALGMTISIKNKNDVETARQIFQSIRFINEK